MGTTFGVDCLIGLGAVDLRQTETNQRKKVKFSDLKIRTRLNMGFGAIVVLLVILVSFVHTNFSKLEQATTWNAHSNQVLDETDGMLESLINIETGERGFALTGNNASLEPLNTGLGSFTKHLAKAKELTSDNSQQQERLQKLEGEERRWLATGIDPVIAMRRNVVDGKDEMASVIALEQAGKGKQGMDAMRVMMSQIKDSETVLLEQRSKDAEALQSLTSYSMIGGGIVAALLAALVAVWLANNITRPLALAIAL
ncbi:MAG TPA: CHASE3 domain-containing protein, partial [Janthinobacterium sp.]|nr:CHASE3 domain-containing protein [Janthinobacterium sp.]